MCLCNTLELKLKSISGYDLASYQSSQNIIHVKSDSRLTFNILYDESPIGIDLNKEKFLHKATVSLDLEGYSVEDLSAEITSPNYPDFYPNSADLSWFVRVPENYLILVTVSDLHIEQCCDRLTIYNGASKQSPVLSDLTGKIVSHSPIVSSSNIMYLRFSSDCSLAERGFKVIISTVPKTNGTNEETTTIGQPSYNLTCSNTDYLYIDTSYTYMYSPGYPYSYTNNLYCRWTLSTYSNFVIQLNVLELNLEQCCDYVNVYDGSSLHYPLLTRLSESTTRLHSTGRYMYITFTTDHSVTDQGFRFRVKATTPQTTTTEKPDENSTPQMSCSGTKYLNIYPHSSYYISSPGYPYSYANYLNCQWRIYCNYYGYVSQLEVLELVFGSNGDYVDVYDGSSDYYHKLARLSQTNPSNDDIISTGRYMYLVFRTDSYGTNKGFRFRISAVVPSTTQKPDDDTTTQAICSGTEYRNIYPGSEIYISSPGYPYYYSNYLSCQWRVYSSYSGYVIQLYIDELDLETSGDYVDVYDGYSSSYSKLSRLSHSTQANYNLFSSGQYMYLSFRTDSYGTARGFRFRVSAVASSERTTTPDSTTSSAQCSGTEYLDASSSTKNIISPGYPNSYYNGLTCTWRITSIYYGNVVQLNVLEIDLETCCDYVDVYDGSSSNYPLIIRLKDQQNTVVHSSDRYMYIRFKTDGSVTRKGFKFIYTSAHPPTEEPEVTTNVGSQYPACHGNGEHLSFYSGQVRYFDSPNYPSYYQPNLMCHWRLYGYFSSGIRLESTYFYISSGDRVVIYDGPSSHYPILKTIYGSSSTKVNVQSTGNDMFIEFITDNYSEYKGFRFQYQESSYTTPAILETTEPEDTTATTWPSCSSGTQQLYASRYSRYYLESPGYPDGYGVYLSCSWLIQTNYYGDRVTLTVVEMHTELYQDYLRLYDGRNSNYRQIASLSGDQSYRTYESTGQELYLYFSTNGVTASYGQQGFRVSYMSFDTVNTHPDTTTEETTIINDQTVNSPACSNSYLYASTSSPNLFSTTGYPNNHPVGLNCFWMITASYYYYTIQLSIIDIDIENGANSNPGLIRIYDGQNSYASLLRSINTNMNAIVYSSGNSMYVTYQSDWNRSFKGFQAAYAAIYRQNCFKVDVPQNTTANPSNETDLLN